ncbi:MAG: AMP-binding protein [Methyloprofundus sp.]|nr:AMP-binding protein [Methyloprofundus sp.]
MLIANTIPELLTQRAQNTGTQTAYWLIDQQDGWTATDWQSFRQKVLLLASGLQAIGLKKGQVIGIMANSCLNWEITHHAILHAGGIVVGLDPNERSEQLSTILKTANITGLFIDQSEQLARIVQYENYALNFTINFTEQVSTNKFLSVPQIIAQQREQPSHPNLPEIHKDDTACIIFTSGTTGTPKGIAYTHKQVLFACQQILAVYPEINESCHLACWLPLANLFQRILNLCAVYGGAQTFLVDNPKKIIEYLPQINPHIFIAVPRFYEKLYNELESQLNKQPLLLKKFIFFSLTQGEKNNAIGLIFRKINTLLLKKFLSLFGHNIRYLVSGSAPMPVWLLKRYYAMNLLILEAYGLSENILPVAMNIPKDYQFGSVGKAMPGNTIMLAEDNELLVQGLCCFSGYLGQEKILNNLDNFYASGDYAKIDSRGFIYLTGRKSEIFKTSTGRKIAPAAIEAIVKQTQGVDQAIIIGANKKFIIAIITVEEHADVLKMVNRLTSNLSSLPPYKFPAGLIISSQSFSLDHNEITANLKLKRKNIQQNYSQYIEQLYSQLADSNSALHKNHVVINSDISFYTLKKIS